MIDPAKANQKSKGEDVDEGDLNRDQRKNRIMIKSCEQFRRKS